MIIESVDIGAEVERIMRGRETPVEKFGGKAA